MFTVKGDLFLDICLGKRLNCARSKGVHNREVSAVLKIQQTVLILAVYFRRRSTAYLCSKLFLKYGFWPKKCDPNEIFHCCIISQLFINLCSQTYREKDCCSPFRMVIFIMKVHVMFKNDDKMIFFVDSLSDLLSSFLNFTAFYEVFGWILFNFFTITRFSELIWWMTLDIWGLLELIVKYIHSKIWKSDFKIINTVALKSDHLENMSVWHSNRRRFCIPNANETSLKMIEYYFTTLPIHMCVRTHIHSLHVHKRIPHTYDTM